MNKLYIKLQRYIKNDFDILELDKYLLKRSTVFDFIIFFANSSKANDYDKITNTDFAEFFEKDYDVELIFQALSEKIIELMGVKFRNSIYETIKNGEVFPFENIGDMALNINRIKSFKMNIDR